MSSKYLKNDFVFFLKTFITISLQSQIIQFKTSFLNFLKYFMLFGNFRGFAQDSYYSWFVLFLYLKLTNIYCSFCSV